MDGETCMKWTRYGDKYEKRRVGGLYFSGTIH